MSPLPAFNSTRQRMADEDERQQFLDAIVEHRSVAKAARSMGLHLQRIYLMGRDDPALAAQIWASRAACADMMTDEVIELSKSKDWQSARLQIETILRLAGILAPKLYNEKAQVNVHLGGIVGAICDEDTRLRLIETRNKLLKSESAETMEAVIIEDSPAEKTPSKETNENPDTDTDIGRADTDGMRNDGH